MLVGLVRDARRFIMYHKWAIEKSPLQAYTSALVFSPGRSLIRGLFKEEEPKWITIKPALGDKWSACLQTLEGHRGLVWSVAFSHDSTRLASASYDNTVKIWDASSGECLRTLKGHTSAVYPVAYAHDSTHTSAVYEVAYSHDSTWLASASHDNTIKIWD